MKGQLEVGTPEEYIAGVAPERRGDIARLDALVREAAPTLERLVRSGMLAYGPFHYRYASGREGDTARICVASNASYISLYALAADEHGYVAERFKARLPKASIGKSCVRFKRLSDLDEAALQDLVRETVRIGLPGVDGPLPVSQAPAGKRPVANKAVANKAVANKPVANKPVAKKVVAKKSSTKR